MDIKENTGIMFNNKNWTEGSKQPRVRGEINVGGKIMEVAMWVKKSANGNTYYSLALKEPRKDEPKTVRETSDESMANFSPYDNLNDTIPF